MKLLSDHKVNIEIRRWSLNKMLLIADCQMVNVYVDIIDEGKVQMYLRSFVYNLKRFLEKCKTKGE